MLLDRLHFPAHTRAERHWLLARAGGGTLDTVLLFLVPCFGQEIFGCYRPTSFFALWCAAAGMATTAFYLVCRFWFEPHDTPAFRRVGFIFCAAVGSAGVLAGMTVLSSLPFYANLLIGMRVSRLFLLLAAGLFFFALATGWFCHRLIPARTKELCRAGRLAEIAGSLLAIAPGLLLWLPGSDLPARFSLAFTLVALWRVISAAPLCCQACTTPGSPIVLGRISLNALKTRRYARLMACVCILAGAGLGAAVPLLFGLGQTVLQSSYDAVQLLLWLTVGRLCLQPALLLLRRWRLAGACAALGLCCVNFALLLILPGRVTFAISALLTLTLADPVQQLCCRLFTAAFCMRQHAVWHSAAWQLCLCGTGAGLLASAVLSLSSGPLIAAILCELFCGAGCALLLIPARRAAGAPEKMPIGSEG